MMTNKTKAIENTSQLRVPKAKNKLGLKIPKIAMPHDDLIVADQPKLEIAPRNSDALTLTSQSSQGSQGTLTTQSSQSSQSADIAPTKNYRKVANSITKQAIPDGLFKGKDKYLYDVLYSLTRGAIEPKRSIRISKTKLMSMADIGSRITFDACIERLSAVGLLKLVIFTGEHQGNEFEILLPEEILTLTSLTSQSLNSMEAEIYVTPKTSFKDNEKHDDERAGAFIDFQEKISMASERLTGKSISERDRENWGRLADLLVLELESAARRAGVISSVPAFLTEVLRRKLLGGNSQLAAKSTTRTRPDTVGKPNAAGEYEKKPLDQAGREAALDELRDFAGEDFLTDFEKWYTEEDWVWLITELDKIKRPELGDRKNDVPAEE